MSKAREKPAGNAVADYSLLTRLAFLLLTALATARAMMLETLREPAPVIPGVVGAPRGAGAGSSLVLDLLCCVPALLILLRTIFPRTYVVRFTIAHAALLLLALWAAISTAWSSDKFAAALTSSHLLAAAAMFWAASQLVRSWLRQRLIAGMCFGLILVYTAHGLIHE